MQTKNPVLFHAMTLKAEAVGMIIVPCDLTRGAVSQLPSGGPVVFVPRSFAAEDQAQLVEDQISKIKERGAA